MVHIGAYSIGVHILPVEGLTLTRVITPWIPRPGVVWATPEARSDHALGGGATPGVWIPNVFPWICQDRSSLSTKSMFFFTAMLQASARNSDFKVSQVCLLSKVPFLAKMITSEKTHGFMCSLGSEWLAI